MDLERVILMKNRVVYLDILKAISIFLICFIHYVMLKPTWFDNFVDMFCFAGVSVFFLVNGALLLNKPLNIKKHYKKMFSMVMILIIWEIISLIYFSILYKTNYQSYSIQDLVSYIFGCIRWVLPTGHFWFIIALTSIYILFPLLKIVYDTKDGKRILLYVVAFIILLDFIPNDINYIQNYILRNINENYILIEVSKLKDYLPFGTYSNVLVYFILGGILHNHFYIQNNRIKYNRLISILMILAGWIYIYIMKGITTGFLGDNFTSLGNGYSCIGTVLLSTGVFLFFINYAKQENRIISTISDNTLGIYYIHCLYLSIVSVYIYPLIDSRGVIINFLKAIIILTLSLVTTIIMKKIPFLKKIV